MQAALCRDELKERPDDPKLHTCLAVDAMQKKNWEEAVRHWKKALQALGGIGEAGHHLNLATAYLRLGQPDRAREEVEQALPFHPESISLHYWLASFWDRARDRERMLAAYTKILPLGKFAKSPQEHYYFAQAVVETESRMRFPEAVEALKIFLESHPKYDPGWTFLGYLFLQMGRMKEGIEALKSGAALKPEHLSIHLLLAQAYLSVGEAGPAILHGNKVLQRAPGHLTANYLVGAAYLKQGDKERGIEHLNRAALSEGTSGRAGLLLGKAYLSEGRLEEALEILQTMAEHRLGDAAIQAAYIRVLIQSGQAAQAVGSADLALEKHPEHLLLRTLKAAALLKRKSLGAAEALLKTILQEDQGFLPAQVEQVRLYQIQKKWDQALRVIRQVIEKQPKHPVGYEMKGTLALSQGDLDTAIKAFRKLVEVKPDHLETWKKLLSLQLQGGEPKRAEKDAGRMIQHFPGLPEGYFAKGLALLQQRKGDIAAPLFRKVIDLEPAHYKAHNALALLNSKASPEDAISHYEASLRALPRQPVIYARISALYLRTGQEASGRRLAQEFIGQYPNQGGGHLLLGMLLLGDQRDAGILHLKKAVALEPQNPAYYLNLGSVYEQAGAKKEAIRLYESAIRNIPKHPVFLNNLAWNYAQVNRLTEALPLAVEAASLRPDDWTIKDTLGWIYYKKGEHKSAIAQFKAAVAINGRHPTLQYHLALSYLAADEQAKALEHLKNAVGAGPFPEEEAARKLLKSMGK